MSSRLAKFLGKPLEFEIEGEKFTVHPLKAKHLSLFMNENMNEEQKMKVAKDIVRLSLLPTESDITDEEVSELPVNIFNKILEKAMEVNGFAEDERTRKVKEQISLKQKNA